MRVGIVGGGPKLMIVGMWAGPNVICDGILGGGPKLMIVGMWAGPKLTIVGM